MADIIAAVATLTWPVMVLAALIYLLPALRRMLSKSESVGIEVGGTRITMQSASDETRKLISDLQDRVNELSAQLERQVTSTIATRSAAPGNSTLLWVDDDPDTSAFERARAKDAGFDVVQADSTNAALKVLGRCRPVVIVSDMGRTENGRFNPTAGLDLLQALRDRGDLTRVVFYSSPRRLAELAQRLDQISDVAYTASPTELAGLLQL